MTATDPAGRPAPAPQGCVYVELRVEGRWAISTLTEGWTDDEKAALLHGDREAREALIDAAESRVMRDPDDVDCVIAEVRLSDTELAAADDQQAP